MRAVRKSVERVRVRPRLRFTAVATDAQRLSSSSSDGSGDGGGGSTVRSRERFTLTRAGDDFYASRRTWYLRVGGERARARSRTHEAL